LFRWDDGWIYPVPYTMLSSEDSEEFRPELEEWAEKEQESRDRQLEAMQRRLESERTERRARAQYRQMAEQLDLMRRNYALENELLRRQLRWY
ncbi:MAG: hypothetical protein Q4C47_04800, partial [Planctomycetia bacterium]|nr:hypothetical protein [Planctomycetia bacterium]